MHLRQHAFLLRSRGEKLFEEGLYQLTQQLEISLFHDINCYIIKTMRNMYRYILDDIGVTNPDSYTPFKLKSKLLNHFRNRVAILALLMSQQLLYQVSGVITPLFLWAPPTIYIYNQTKSKEFITLNNRLGQGISYDKLQRQLTSQTVSIMQQAEVDAVLIPAEMTHNPTTCVRHRQPRLDEQDS